MPLFRFSNQKSPYFVELSWPGISYRKQKITVNLTEKKTSGNFETVEELGFIDHDPKTAQKGYSIVSKKLGTILVKWVRKFLIVEKIVVIINGEEAPGSEVLRFANGVNLGKHV